jgi:hypothetical protein
MIVLNLTTFINGIPSPNGHHHTMKFIFGHNIVINCMIYVGDDFDLIQQEIALMQDCQHDNIVRCIGSYLRYG